MRRSTFFIPTLKEQPREASIVSHRLMLRAGMIQQITHGIYSFLPLALRVLNKIRHIIAQEQERIGCYEMIAPTLHPVDLWKQSGRYDDYGREMLRLQDRHQKELIYGPTAEEIFTHVIAKHVVSYKELPKRLFNMQWKFRDEARPRFGVMRGREFLMKDAYSFDLTKEEALKSYEAMMGAYMATFQRMGLRAIPLRASTGPIGGDLSDEFHILSQTGESQLFYDGRLENLEPPYTIERVRQFYAAADDLHDSHQCPVPKEYLKTSRGIEVGHIFYFGNKYSRPMGAYVSNPEGEKIPLEMGSYGIGISRLLGAIIEASHDDRGIIWPDSVSPFHVHFLNLDKKSVPQGDLFYQQMLEKDIEVLYEDRIEISPGSSFADMDLLGISHQVIMGKNYQKSGLLEWRNRKTQECLELTPESLLNKLKGY
jgi:prolyl-tRNA synthetase